MYELLIAVLSVAIGTALTGGHDRMHCRYTLDVIIVFTGTVAHKMPSAASRQAEKTGTPIKHCHFSSACALKEALREHFGGK